MPNSPAPIGSAEVCTRLGIDRSTLSRWVAAGRITPTFQLPSKNGAMLFDPADVKALAAELAAQGRAS
jgi:predicted site-specific integrase-resolvase